MKLPVLFLAICALFTITVCAPTNSTTSSANHVETIAIASNNETFILGREPVPGSIHLGDDLWFSNLSFSIVPQSPGQSTAKLDRLCAPPSSDINQGSAISPLVLHCDRMMYNIRNGGTWTVAFNAQRTLTTQGSCAFGAMAHRYGGRADDWYAYVGNEDIITAISESIRLWAWTDEEGKERVGTKGVMNCDGNPFSSPDAWLDWGLYATGDHEDGA